MHSVGDELLEFRIVHFEYRVELDVKLCLLYTSFSGKVESILYALYATLADVVRQIPYFRRLAAGWQGSSHVG